MRRSERGLTLVEVLSAVVISGIIFAVMTRATIVGLKTVDNANDRLAGSNDTQLVASYFTGDVDSADRISTLGTTEQAAPSVGVSANSRVVSFWTLPTVTEIAPPNEWMKRWERRAAAPSTLTVAMADDTAFADGTIRSPIATSTTRATSVGHTIALAPATGALQPPVAFRSASAPGTAGPTQLTIANPPGTVVGDVMLAQIAVTNSSAAIGSPVQWSLVNDRAIPGTRSFLYVRRLASTDPASWTWTFGSGDAVVGAIASYSGVATIGANATDISPCGGESPVLLVSWTDLGIDNEVAYVARAEDEEVQLVRRHCEGTTGTPDSEQVLARELNSTKVSDVFAECQPASCTLGQRVDVTLTLTERPLHGESVPRRYQMRAATRTNR